MGLERIVLVTRQTALQQLMQRHSTSSQIKFYLESRGKSFQDYQQAHDDYRKGLGVVMAAISSTIPIQLVPKEMLATYSVSEKDAIVVVGDAGLLVNAAKYVGEQPIINVNPDQKRFDDVFTTCTPAEFPNVLQRTIDGKSGIEQLTMAEAALEDGQRMYALNDLFIGRRIHASARYWIEYEGSKENQSSSGVIVSTGTGSTGWLTSVMMGAHAIAGGDYLPQDAAFPRNSDYLVFTVREPFPSKITGTSIIHGKITREKPLKIFSNMPEEGVIFSDGVEQDYLEFAAGKTATIMPAEKKAQLVMALHRKQ